MKVNKRIIVLVIGAILGYYVVSNFKKEETKNSAMLQTKVIELNYGFGYEIYGEEKLLIRQEFIPSIAGEVRFVSFEEANEVANFVKDKISKGESPVVSTQELENLNISF